MGLKIYKALLTVLVTWLLFCPFFEADAVSGATDAKVLHWIRLDTPQSGIMGKHVLVLNSEVNRIAVGNDNKTIYALDSQNSRLYKSADNGYGWTDLTSRLFDAGATARFDEIATAPDNADIVAVITDNRTRVYFSFNGGYTFIATTVLALRINEVITSMAISSLYSMEGGSFRDLIIGTGDMSAGSGVGRVFIMTLPPVSSWMDVSTGTIGWSLPVDVFSIVFSPNYSQDKTMLAVVADTADTYLYVGQKITFNTVVWNTWDGYPVEIAQNDQDSPPSPLRYASLALPSDFLGSDIFLYRIYASWSDGSGGNANDDVYRVDNIQTVRLYAANGAEFVAMSLAYYGTYNSGKLLAGTSFGTGAIQVLGTFTPQIRFPIWMGSSKPPTGGNEVRLAWSPDGKVAYCGTSTAGGATNDESSFSRSIDSGLTWNQTGLIDTIISFINDIEVTPKGDTLFMTTVNAGAAFADSLWQSASLSEGKWKRILARRSATDSPIVRIDPDYDTTKVVLYAEKESRALFISKDGGNKFTSLNPGLTVTDIAVEDKDTFYILDSAGFMTRSSDGGWNWSKPVDTFLGSGYSIACARTTSIPKNPKGHVIVGSRGIGNYLDVAYSTDGGTTFTQISPSLPTRGNTLVVTSSAYKEDGTILVINQGGMYAWGIYSGQTEWGQWWWGGVTGLAISTNYGFYFSTPAFLPWFPASVWMRWNQAKSGLDDNIDFGFDPTKGLKLSGGLLVNEPVTVWVIDRRPYNPPQGGIWFYTDTLGWLGPAPVMPASGTIIGYNTGTTEVVLQWKRRSLSTGYQVQVATDEDFTHRVIDIGSGWLSPFYTPLSVETPALIIPSGGGTITDGIGNTWILPKLAPGTTYYWRVRTRSVANGDPTGSPWSWTESFSIRLGPEFPVEEGYLQSPVAGATVTLPGAPTFTWRKVVWADNYKVIVAKDDNFKNIVKESPLITTTSWKGSGLEVGEYWWKVQVFREGEVNIETETGSFKVVEAVIPMLPLTPIWTWVIVALWFILLALVLKLAHGLFLRE